MARCVAAIDQGTTSTRCILFDEHAQVLAVDQAEHEQIFPAPGHVEHDPREVWERTRQVVRGALEQGGVTAADVAAIGITNQRETTAFWNRKTGKPYGNAIVWQDTRTQAVCDELAGDVGPDRYRAVTGLPLATYFSGPKIRWALENREGLRAAAERGEAVVGTMDSWVLWNLTGGPDGGRHVVDVTNASRTLLMDLERLAWDEGILDDFGIPKAMLPEIVPCSDAEAYGRTHAAGPFGGRVTIAGDLGDQHAALLGQGCTQPGDAKNTYGTGCFVLSNTGEHPTRSEHGLLTTLAWKIGTAPAMYALEGSIAITGALVQWLRDNLGLVERSSDVEALARSVDDNGGAYVVPAFSGLYAPHWRPDARGVICGLTRYVNKGHLARAALEATAYQTLDVIDAMRADVSAELEALKVDGGMTVNELLMQFQADVLDLPVERPAVVETTALGAAYAAGLAVDFFPGLDEWRAGWRAERRFEPAMDAETRARLVAGWRKAITKSLDWA